MHIDTTAPAVARDEIEISAAPELVWEVLADVRGWPAWNPDVKSVHAEGALAEGESFRWKSGPGTITSTVRQVDRPRRLAWTGSTFGIRAVHVYRLDALDGGTVVASEESWDGVLVRALRNRMRRTLQQALSSGLRALKAEAERRGAAQ